MEALIRRAPGFEFVFISAPSGRVWMRDPPGGKGAPTTDPNWDLASLQLLDETVRTQGPFHGLLGYSQGAAYVNAYLAHAPSDTFQVAVMYCGYLPSTHLGIVARINNASPLSTTALIFMGVNDYVITNSMTDETIPKYTAPVVVRSSAAGHG